MKKSLLVSAAVFLMAGFGATPEPAPVRAQNRGASVVQLGNEVSNSQITPAELELLSTGGEPKLKLEFIPPAIGAEERLKMSVDMNLNMAIAGRPMPSFEMPTMEMSFQSKVTQVDNNGDVYLELICADANFADAASFPPEVMEQMRSQMQQFIGLKSSFVIDAAGHTKDISFDFPPNTDPNAMRMYEQMFASLSELSAPSLDEAIGIGAQWQVTASVPTGSGINVVQVSTYEVVDLQDNLMTIDFETQQQADPQNMSLPGMPPNAKVNLTAYEGQGEGQIAIEVGKIMPIRAQLSMATNSAMQITVIEGGKEEQTTMDSNVLMQINLESN
ncbi:hypothetical protein [Phormidium sp. CCY1219]|uniref:hypothetical protein n=1 Tax=Phormidium sp. CCY1219 TaxID=2886104 RepID=UPI002D1E9767|nr:hypothetical protein [Phormidium sp. CCY1219]MEB3831077.1 hypothetical protein [Phormidium sp. CCY1219]